MGFSGLEVLDYSRTECGEVPGAITDWHKEHILPPTQIEELLLDFKIRFLRMLSFFKPAPLVAGIDPDLQERSYFKLLWAKLNDARGDFASFKL